MGYEQALTDLKEWTIDLELHADVPDLPKNTFWSSFAHAIFTYLDISASHKTRYPCLPCLLMAVSNYDCVLQSLKAHMQLET